MKKLLLFICLMILTVALFAQQKKQEKNVLSMQHYLDSLKRKNQLALKTPADLLKKKQASVVSKPLKIISLPPSHIVTRGIPVWSPDSNYVYNMPGTHAFDKSKLKRGIFFFVPENTESKK